MIDNAFVWIDGSPGSGKTSLIERILQSNRSKSIGVVRFRKNPKLRAPKEIAAGSEETQRYLSAGAQGALLMEYPPNSKNTSVTEDFWCTNFLGNLFNAVYCEAELTDDQFPTDLSVFVIPPLENPASIFESRQIKVDEQLMRDYFTQAFGHIAPAMDNFSSSFDDCINEVLAQTVGKLEAMPPLTFLRLAPGFEGLINASTVAVNIRDQRERESAERLLEYVDEVGRGAGANRIERTFGYFWRPKKSMFICNLADARDPDSRKLVTMIKRRFVER